MAYETKVLLDGLGFGEGPRWHDGRLWFSDIDMRKVMTVDLNGRAETVVEMPTAPSGLGWLPDGRLLIVSMPDRRLLRLDPNGLVEVSDLSQLASGQCNDMVVDQQGRAYIGNFGFGSPPAPAEIVLVTPDGDARVVADEMVFPNGTVITPDGRTLVVAETFASRLTAFDVEPDGSLTGRRVWAQLEVANPDGICLDAEGAIWVASPGNQGVVRVREGGEIADRIAVSTWGIACMLGGPHRRTLFVLTAEPWDFQEPPARRRGRIEVVEVDVPGAGFP